MLVRGWGHGGIMYLRKIYPRGRGRRQVYWELVESYRTAKGSRQRTVAYLGKLSRKEVSGWEILSDRLNGRPPASLGLFDVPETESDGDGDRFELVDIESVAVERMRRFGDVFLAWTLWRMLGLDGLLAREMAEGREQVPWALVAAILCISRLCRPSSELHIEKHFYPQSALADLLGVEASLVHTDRLYAGLDELLKQKKAIEQHLRRRLGELFQLSYDVLLYDLTSTYFEGQCAANPKAIAYAMWKTLEGWMNASGLGDAPRPLMQELSTIQSADVKLPTRPTGGSASTTLVIRCVTRPDEHQQVLLNRLGLELPNHLKRFRMEEEAQTATAVTM
jgi:hypothetical protein